MNLTDYFEKTQGIGVLATADSEGNVDVALYARPHVIDEATLAFIMCDRLSHRNLSSNPKAAYIFVENGPGYKGKRLYLTKQREETDPDLIESMKRRKTDAYPDTGENKYLVYFRLDNVRPLVGDNS
jgi:hypothetical protein